MFDDATYIPASEIEYLLETGETGKTLTVLFEKIIASLHEGLSPNFILGKVIIDNDLEVPGDADEDDNEILFDEDEEKKPL